jgi:hypothetical protein
MRREEDAIQRCVLQHLKARAVPGCFYFAVPMGGLRSRTEAAILNGLGSMAGIPDLVLICAGRTFGLELKAIGGRLSRAQIATQEAMRAAGAEVETAFGLDEAIGQLEAWHLLRGRVQ